MSNELLKRASQLLEGRDTRKTQTPSSLSGQAKGSEIMARAEAALGGSIKRAAPLPPVAAPRVERVRLPMTCSASGRAYTVIAERHGDVLRFVDHELLQEGNGLGNARRMPGQLAGQYHIDYSGWACPLCSTARGVWMCGCPQMQSAMHCMGASGGRQHCACGRFEEHEFTAVERTAVRGSSEAHAPKSSGPAMRIQSSGKQVTHGTLPRQGS